MKNQITNNNLNHHELVEDEILSKIIVELTNKKLPVGEYITPDAYVDLMLKIQSEGLLPSVGEHQNIDENLRPVFTVPNYEDTHGILFFELNPLEKGYAVFIGVDDEHLIYTPRLKIPMGLCLKSTWFVETDRIEGAINPNDKRSEVMDYRNNLESRLRERDVPFTLVEPK